MLMQSEDPVLSVEGLTKHFPSPRRSFLGPGEKVHALEDVSFSVHRRETLAVVGESGCGKSTAARLVLRLLEPTSGRILFRGEDITSLSHGKLKPIRQRMQAVFQDPFASLNPRMTVRQLIAEPLVNYRMGSPREISERVDDLLRRVGLQPEAARRLPHEFSGGQRQRIGIARALALSPELVVCDEAVSALDVSVQAQILNLLMALQEEVGLAYLFISHDLAVVKHISDRVAVMYLGQLVELAPSSEIFSNARHPYTEALLSAVPKPDPLQKSARIVLQGDMPSPLAPPSGCRFRTRCPIAAPRCAEEAPARRIVAANHLVACHFRQ